MICRLNKTPAPDGPVSREVSGAGNMVRFAGLAAAAGRPADPGNHSGRGQRHGVDAGGSESGGPGADGRHRPGPLLPPP